MLVTTITIDIFRLVLYSTFKPYIACDRPVDHVYNVGGKLFSEILEVGKGLIRRFNFISVQGTHDL